jgi:molybdopterin synthase sulfur carrier subunit
MEWKLFADLADSTERRHVTVDVEPGATVSDALEALLEQHPDLEERVLTEEGELQPHVSVLQNGTNLTTDTGGLETTTNEGDELALLPPVSGG